MAIIKPEMLKKVLIKKGGVVHHEVYNKYDHQSDPYYYYVIYTSEPDENGMYSIHTNSSNFGEKAIISQTKDKGEAIKIAEAINKAFRLMAGY
ncbi:MULTISPECIES: hypothetical protein [Niastella]|uniref:Uncharacterized protein n=1 Tax=Niastella soli TaxID=2821487 RepID=A0ABS3YV97_9BACT|nr:hypothetical protein [Niastella soli]MBO9201803.1 hypothetical protein [Niastella soli]